VDFSTQRLFPRPFYPQILLQSRFFITESLLVQFGFPLSETGDLR
jgi:hypothetical protein